MTNKPFKNAFFLCLIFALSALPTFAGDEEDPLFIWSKVNASLTKQEENLIQNLTFSSPNTVSPYSPEAPEEESSDTEAIPSSNSSLRQRFPQPNAASSYPTRTQAMEEVDADSCGDLLCCCFCILSPFVIQLGAFLAANAPS